MTTLKILTEVRKDILETMPVRCKETGTIYIGNLAALRITRTWMHRKRVKVLYDTLSQNDGKFDINCESLNY